MNRILFVGELNPYGSDPAMALYPYPRNASGNRLREILRLSDREYIYQHDRVNLCTRAWSLKAARIVARELVVQRTDPTGAARYGLVLCGAKVAAAFGTVFTAGELYHFPNGQPTILVIPHPSGRNRYWNDHDNLQAMQAAYTALRAIVGLPAVGS